MSTARSRLIKELTTVTAISTGKGESLCLKTGVWDLAKGAGEELMAKGYWTEIMLSRFLGATL